MPTSRNFWPLGVVLAFVIFLAGTAGLLVLASTQKTDLVSANYYEQELKYQTRIDSSARARELSTNASVAYDPAGRHIIVSLPPGHVKANAIGQIQFYRPSASELDRQCNLETDATGVQSLDVSNLPNGLWKIRVAWTAAGKEYFLDQKIVIGAGGNRPGRTP